MAKLPEYLASINFRCPEDPDNALFQYALSTKLNMFQWLETQPEQLAVFSAYNAASTKSRGPVLRAAFSALLPPKGSTTPSEGTSFEEDQVLLVDVGAGHGQILGDFRKERPDLVGRIIAQDLPQVTAGRDIIDGVENMAFDFLQRQPVKGDYHPLFYLRGLIYRFRNSADDYFRRRSQQSFQTDARTLGASIYFFSHIFHDWPDVTCRQILTNTLPALTPNYSRIVIVDQVLPNTGASTLSSFMDLSMMNFAGMERTERQWRELLEGVGLSVVMIERPKVDMPGADGRIIAILK